MVRWTLDMMAETQKEIEYWHFVMQQIAVTNTLFKKRDIRLVTYLSGNSSSQFMP